jgi:hypothetical protein
MWYCESEKASSLLRLEVSSGSHLRSTFCATATYAKVSLSKTERWSYCSIGFMAMAMCCCSGPGPFCISIGVAIYDMVDVSKPSMAVVRIGVGYAHTRDGRRGAGDGRGARARVVEGGGGSSGEARLVVTVRRWRRGEAGDDGRSGVGEARTRVVFGGEGLGDGGVADADADADASAAEGVKPAERAHQTILL